MLVSICHLMRTFLSKSFPVYDDLSSKKSINDHLSANFLADHNLRDNLPVNWFYSFYNHSNLLV